MDSGEPRPSAEKKFWTLPSRLPLVLPPTVLGYYLLVLLGRASPIGHLYEWLFGGPLVFTWQAAVVASLFHSTPLLVKSARAAFESVDRSYERAARNLGATELRLFWRVTLPLVRRSILAAAALAFARSLGDFGVTLMIAGNIPGRTQTVSIAIFDAVEGEQRRRRPRAGADCLRASRWSS